MLIYDKARGAYVVICQENSPETEPGSQMEPPDHADYYFATFGGLRRRSYERGLNRLKLLSGERRGRVLDVGCAYGLFLHLAQQQGWAVSGLEPGPSQAAFAREHFHLPVCSSRIEDFDTEGQWDLITFWDVLEHLPQPEAVLGKVRKWLEDDGVLLIKVPNARGLLHRLSFLSYWLTGGRFKFALNKITENHHYIYTKASLDKIIQQQGFTEVITYYEDMIDKEVLAKKDYIKRLPKNLQLLIIYSFKMVLSLSTWLTMQDSIVTYYKKKEPKAIINNKKV